MKTNIRTISIDELDGFGIDDDNNLYWKQKPVKLEKRFRFSWWQGFLATIAAFGTLASGLVDIIQFINS